MQNYVYEQLANALNKLPNGFPRTRSHVEIKVLKKIFLPEEASIASQLNISMESVETIAKRIAALASKGERDAHALCDNALIAEGFLK